LEDSLNVRLKRTELDEYLLERLKDSVLALREQRNRIDVAIPVWRDIAERLSSGEPIVASKATVEMCLVRTGARAGIVRSLDEGRLQTLAWQGQWSADRQSPRDIFPDATIATAIERGEPVLASDIDASAEDSARRGILHRNLQSAEFHDLISMADWLAKSIASHRGDGALDAGAANPTVAEDPAVELEWSDIGDEARSSTSYRMVKGRRAGERRLRLVKD
jgi:hypothetical protein